MDENKPRQKVYILFMTIENVCVAFIVYMKTGSTTTAAWRMLLLLILFYFATTVFAQRLPTDSELRAAYCIPMMQTEIKLFRDVYPGFESSIRDDEQQGSDLLSQKRQTNLRELNMKALDRLQRVISDRESALNRLQFYLIPRMSHLDSTSLLAASKRAASDDTKGRVCSEKCVQQSDLFVPVTETDACYKECIGADLHARLETCRNPAWLPF